MSNQELLDYSRKVGDTVAVLYLEGKYLEHEKDYTTYQWLDAMIRLGKYKENVNKLC